MNDYQQIKQSLELAGILCESDAPLAPHSTFKIGGTARLAVFPADRDQLVRALIEVSEGDIKFRIAGNGSNILFRDGTFDGVIIFTRGVKDVSFEGNILTAGCGAPLTAAAAAAQQKGLAGLEFAYGIPGSVGGAVYMNAGAYGGQMSDVIHSSIYFDIKSREILTLPRTAHTFGYRESYYSSQAGEGGIILSAKMELTRANPTDIKTKMDANMRSRIEKQPLDMPSAGSVFKRYPGYYIGKIIEDSGLKGRQIGGAQVSLKHAGFIVNTGKATAEDVLALIGHIKDVIREKYKIELCCEICVI